jgi:hypothetical protein
MGTMAQYEDTTYQLLFLLGTIILVFSLYLNVYLLYTNTILV